MLKSDNSSLAKDCRKEIKGITSKVAKLGRKVRNLHCANFVFRVNRNSARSSRASPPRSPSWAARCEIFTVQISFFE